MDTSSSGIRFSAILRWAFAFIVAVAAMACAPCLAFADDVFENAGDGAAHAAAVVDDDSADLASLSGDPDESASAHDAVASGAIDQDSGATTEGESTPAPKEDDDDGRFVNDRASDSGPADSNASDSGAADSKIGDSNPTSDGAEPTDKGNPVDASTKTDGDPIANDADSQTADKATAPVLPIEVEAKLPQDEPVVLKTRHVSAHIAVDTAPNPQFTCSDACDQPLAGEEREGGSPSGRAPIPASPSRSAFPSKDAPAPTTPVSSWGERHANGGQAFDDLAVIPESRILNVACCQAPCASSRNVCADDSHRGPERCRSPGSIGR